MKTSTSSLNLANTIIKERTMLSDANKQRSKESWDAILDHPGFWSLRHESHIYSVKNMSDEDLQKSLIEDMLFVANEINLGSKAIYPMIQPFRHLKTPISDAMSELRRIRIAVEFMISENYVLRIRDDDTRQYLLVLNPDRMEDAQDFSGVYYKIPGSSEPSPDVFDSLITAGGSELLAETIDEILIEFGKLQ